ncbi:hypothetical protein XENOCAPTIV_020058 [Xenoophorus captivus]|uniref:Uncharacterized protein n=1 Tax=Xenoophorus captivus TaxID=1517983 RepID=A0ABV0R9P9_9TELE
MAPSMVVKSKLDRLTDFLPLKPKDFVIILLLFCYYYLQEWFTESEAFSKLMNIAAKYCLESMVEVLLHIHDQNRNQTVQEITNCWPRDNKLTVYQQVSTEP